MSTPRFLAIEGLDGTGKSTLAVALASRLGATLLQTPPRELHKVRPMLDRTFASSPIAAQLFYSATVVYASDRARVLLGQGTSVVVDRYWVSTVVYASCRVAHVDLGVVEAELLRPDLTVFVDTDEPVRRQRLLARGMTDADRDSVAQWDALRERYLTTLSRPRVSRAVLYLDSTRCHTEELVERVLAEVA